MRTRIKLFSKGDPDNLEIEVDKFMQIIESGGGEIIDVKFSSVEISFDIMVIYKSL